MDIKDIKAKLSILEVLQHYGLRPDKNDRLKCPFHPDKTPSLQVYPKTNTFLEIPDHVDPPFRIMLTHHSGKVTHLISHKEKDRVSGIMLSIPGC